MGESISQYVLKVHSRCDLACDHCYVYEHADQTWHAKPRVITPATAGMAATRIAQHAADRQLAHVSIILHGGEPLLLGKARMRALLGTLAALISQVSEMDLRIHTNGVQLDEQWCDLFAEYGVQVGVSLDGDRAANDRHRRYADGRSSYSRVLAALTLLSQRYRRIYAGILCTVDLRNDPVAVYRALVEQQPPALDLLLPHATWERPPDRPAGHQTAYADWLMRVFECWDNDGRSVPIRIFDSVLSASRGGPSFTEAIGTDPADLLVIDTDGAWEQPDSMKTAFDGAAATGMNVFDHPVSTVARHPAVRARQRGTGALCATCQACPVVQVCGGGLYAHRFRPTPGTSRLAEGGGTVLFDENEFDNPSAYCADLMALISRMTAAERRADTAADARPHGGRTRQDHPELEVPAGALESLAAGPGDVGAVAALAAIRLSEARSLVARVAASEAGWHDAGLRAAAAEGWALLCELDRAYSGPVQEVFEHPYIYAWALRCLRPPPGADTDLDRAHLAGLASAAALRAGVTAELPVPVRHGLVHVPTVGALAVPSGDGSTKVVSIVPGKPPASRGGGRWRTARYVSTVPFARLAVEDLDPFRDCQQWPASSRLSSAAWRAWQRRLASSGWELAQDVPGYAQVLGAGLRAVVPLCSAAAGHRSSTARQAPGAVAVALPGRNASRGALGELLLHEFQHAKLNVLLDRRRLFDPGYRWRLRVPWRPEPRPVEGVLHGLYAYLAVTHLYQSRGRRARAGYLQCRSWVADTATELLKAGGALTPDGRRFVTGLAAAAEGEAG
jgi:uncharacterized protein